MWSPTQQAEGAAEGKGELSLFAKVKVMQLALDIAEGERWTVLYLVLTHGECPVGMVTAMETEQQAAER